MEDMKVIQEMCELQEDRFQFSAFSRADALKLGLMLHDRAQEYDGGVAIEITINGLSVFRYLPEGTTVDNTLWLARKVNTVRQSGRSSLHEMANLALAGETLTDRKLEEREFALCGGGFPLVLRGTGMVGVIAVSGLPHLEDHRLIAETLAEWFGQV